MAEPLNHSNDIGKWLKLIRAKGIGPATFTRLIKHFGSPDAVLGTSVRQLTHIEGIGLKSAEQIARTRHKFDTEAELKLADKLNVTILHLNDSRYPPVLKKIYDPPPVIYLKGNFNKNDNLCIAIVGSRRCSLYGREQASRLAYLLASAGFNICSGMARGIDSAAHHGALSAKGRTIAVQGCGLAKIFPPENEKLFSHISKSGCCISELPLNYGPLPENFPPRNRIIAGLSLATIVIEAPLRSGALITARAALENNREVMAVPGKIDSPLSKGAHQLIKHGAQLVESIEDVLEALGYIGEQLMEHGTAAANDATQKVKSPLFAPQKLNLSPDEKSIRDYLTKEPIHIEQIIAQTDLSPGQINAALISLQLKGLVNSHPANFFSKK